MRSTSTINNFLSLFQLTLLVRLEHNGFRLSVALYFRYGARSEQFVSLPPCLYIQLIIHTRRFTHYRPQGQAQ
jgi:hypothetical protein